MVNEENENLNENEAKEEAEKVEEETPVENKEKPQSKGEVVNKPDADDEAYEVAIENARKDLYNAYNQSRKISNFITVIVLIVAIGAMLLITQENVVMTFCGWGLAGASLVGLVVYYFINKNKFPDRTRAYIKDLTKRLNENTFADERFTEVTSDPAEKMSVEDVVGDSVFDNLGNVASRNVVRGKFNDNPFLYGEMALSKAAATKKDAPLFVGKYISLNNKLELRGRIIINFRSKENPVDIPTNVGNLNLLEETDGMYVWGLKDVDYKKVLGTLFLSKIKALVPEKHLVNTNIVVWAGKTGFYLSYDDASMALPFDKPFDKACNEQGVSNVLTAFECNDNLGK